MFLQKYSNTAFSKIILHDSPGGNFRSFLGWELNSTTPCSEDDERDDVSEEPQESNTARQDACDPPPQEYLDKIEVKILQRVLFIIFIFTIQTMYFFR